MGSANEFTYEGSELDLFSNATNWRNYWASFITPYLGRSVLEVGAGIGSVTQLLHKPGMSWTALEPDPVLATRIASQVDGRTVLVGSIDDVPEESLFDSVLYIDVLEHIEDDRQEVRKAFDHVAPGGRLVVLAPAHQWLFTPFDESIGHHRRYSMKDLRNLKPNGAVEERGLYLDSVGTLASIGNRTLLKSADPNRSQITFWDKRLVPLSRVLDSLTANRIGKTVVLIWRRQPAQT